MSHLTEKLHFSTSWLWTSENQKMKVFLGINEKKNSEKDLNKIEASFAGRKQKINSVKIKPQNC